MREIFRGTKASHAFKDYAGFEANFPTQLRGPVKVGTISTHHHHQHPSLSTSLTHRQMSLPQADGTYSPTARHLQAVRWQGQRRPDFRRHRLEMTMWSRALANGVLDTCGRRPMTWSMPNSATPSCSSRVLASQILSFSRASGGTSTGPQGKCRGCSPRRTVNPISGVRGRSSTQTTDAFDNRFPMFFHGLIYYHAAVHITTSRSSSNTLASTTWSWHRKKRLGLHVSVAEKAARRL